MSKYLSLLKLSQSNTTEAAYYACKFGYDEVFWYCYDKGFLSKQACCFEASLNGRTEIVLHLLTDLPGQKQYDHSIRAAAHGGHLKLVRKLLRDGVDLNATLEGAAEGGDLETVIYLLALNPDFETVALKAAGSGQFDIVKYVLDTVQLSEPALRNLFNLTSSFAHIILFKPYYDDDRSLEICKRLLSENKFSNEFLEEAAFHAVDVKRRDIAQLIFDRVPCKERVLLRHQTQRARVERPLPVPPQPPTFLDRFANFVTGLFE
jgi:hypothetical protein